MINFSYNGKGIAFLRELSKNYDKSFLTDLFYKMYRIRLVEEAVAARYHEDEMKTPIHLAVGQEAIAVGVCGVLKNEDYAYCHHRTHASYLAKGGDLKTMLAEFYCRLTGCCGSRGGSMHLIDKRVGMLGSSAIVGGAIPIATGFALSAQIQNLDRLSVVFFGDAAMEEGVAYESLNFAALRKLPILYICENNYYSVCSPLHYRQPRQVEIYKKAEAFGIKSEKVDGNNVLAVFEACQKAVEHIKKGLGPVFIEATAYRWFGHHGSEIDVNTGYRTSAELELWKKVDPLEMLKAVLIENFQVTLQDIQRWELDINLEIEQAFEFAMNSPNPTEQDLTKYVYSV